MVHSNILFLPTLYTMAIRLYSKHTLFSLALIICILVAYMRQFPETENNDKQSYFENMQKGAATTPFDLPVHIITGQKINPSQASTENTTQTTIGISSNATCASDEELCNKIKFI